MYRFHVLRPARALHLELGPPIPCQLIETRSLSGLCVAPLGLDPAALLHAVERLVERPVLQPYDALGRPLELRRNSVAMKLAVTKRAEDQHVQRPTDELAGGIGHWGPVEVVDSEGAFAPGL